MIKQVLDASYDAISILICIRVVSQCIRIMQKRCIPALDNFLNGMLINMWPRFQAIVDMHIESVRRIDAAKLISPNDSHPHFIFRRYAEFASSVLTLNQGYDEMLLMNRYVFFVVDE